MSRLTSRALAATSLAAGVALVTAGCGDTAGRAAAPTAPASAGGAEARAGNGDWLLRFATAEGEDGEQSRAVLVRFNPTTGAASSRALPVQNAGDASQDEEALLVSADHAWAIADTGVPKAEARTGKLVLYSVTSDATDIVDIRALTADPELTAEGWAFDPTAPSTLRVVDRAGNVWKVDLAAKSATRESRLPAKDGWIFGNGFDKESGAPYLESIDSDQTDPAGKGDSDARPVQRQGGTLLRYDGQALDGLPTPPCGFAGGFQYDDGAAWLFCADTPSITAYQAVKGGASWHQFGTPSQVVVPKAVAQLDFVLPPAS
jgi:hypothetical protein